MDGAWKAQETKRMKGADKTDLANNSLVHVRKKHVLLLGQLWPQWISRFSLCICRGPDNDLRVCSIWAHAGFGVQGPGPLCTSSDFTGLGEETTVLYQQHLFRYTEP